MNKVYLSVTAHPDDEVLGFGGTAYQLTKAGHTVVNCILSGKVEVRVNRPDIEELNQDIKKAEQILGCQPSILGDFPNIRFNTIPHIDLVRFIEQAIELVQPDCIFTHHPYDLNNDHHQVSIACQAAARLFQRKPTKPLEGLYFMEILSSTDWSFAQSGMQFQPNAFFQIGEDGLEKKIQALEAYRGVMRDYPHPRSKEVITGLAASRGAQAGLNYAESFQTAFQILSI